MKINKTALNLFILLAANLIWASEIAFAARPDYYGYSPALPKTLELPKFELNFPFIQNEQSILLLLEIDQSGSFKKAVLDNAGDSVVSKYVLSSLNNLSFEPALKKGQPCLSTLPVWARVNPRFREATIEFPVGADFQITNRSLYFQALKLLGVEFPKIRTFPPYFCDLSPRDSLDFLPFALIKLNLNDSGQVNSSEIVNASLPAFARQIESAALWAGFSPLKVDGKAEPGSAFLLVSFFPQLQYPTNEIEIKNDSIYPWHERWRVQLLPDTVGLMLPAMPQNRDIIELTLSGKDRLNSGEVVADLIVDTLGNVKVRSIDTKNPPRHKAVAFALKDVKFFPATGYNGKLVNFNGKARFYFRNSSKVQVEYLWLNE